MPEKIREIYSIIWDSTPNISRLQHLVDITDDIEFEHQSGRILFMIAANLNFFKDYKRAKRIFEICAKKENECSKWAQHAILNLVLNHVDVL